MKVAGIPFLVTISRHITFGSAGKLDNMKNSHILKNFKTLILRCIRYQRCFKVTIILAYNQFEPMCGNLEDLHTQLHITSWDMHISEIMLFNCTVKDRVCCTYNIILFDYLSPIIVIDMVYSAVFWRNMFPLRVAYPRHKAHMRSYSIAHWTSALIVRWNLLSTCKQTKNTTTQYNHAQSEPLSQDQATMTEVVIT